MRLGPDALEAVCGLHARLHAEAAQPGLFAVETRDFFAGHLEADGTILGLFDDAGELAAYTVLGLPHADDPKNFGFDIDLPRALRANVAHLDGTGVRPDWRGRGLQRQLVVARRRIAEAAGRDLHLAMAAPANPWSLANALAGGLRIVALVPKYGAERFVLRADGPRSIRRPASPAGPTVPLTGDLAEHRSLLAQGWEGFALHRSDSGDASIVYAPARARHP